MFVIKKGEEKKNLFITRNEPSFVQKIKINSIKPQKIQTSPKIKEKEKEKEQIKNIEKKNIIIPPQIQKNLFSILHNQNQVMNDTPPKLTVTHLKKKRFIDDDTGNTIGRWSRDEHKKFIEAIIKFGNNWKEVQEYVNTRTSTQARSHAQKFFEKIKKNNTLQYFDSLNNDYSENFTNSTILQLHNSYGNKSKSEINSIVNKFLSLEYDLPKKRRKMINNNNINGISRKKNIGNKNKKNNYNEGMINNRLYAEQEGNEDINNKCDNNSFQNRYNNYNENPKNIIRNNIIIENCNLQEYISNNINECNDNQKNKITDNINNMNNIHNDNCQYNYDYNYIPQNIIYNPQNIIYNPQNIDYILNQFVNNLSTDIYPNGLKMKPSKRKNTFESIEDNSYMNQENNLADLNNQNNYNYQSYNIKSRKNSVDSINNLIQNDNNDFKDFCKKLFELEDSNQNNQNKTPFEDFRNQNIYEDDLQMNLLKNIK